MMIINFIIIITVWESFEREKMLNVMWVYFKPRNKFSNFQKKIKKDERKGKDDGAE